MIPEHQTSGLSMTVAEDWAYYDCQVDDHEASVFVDLGLIDSAPQTYRTWLCKVTVDLRYETPSGLSAEMEKDALFAIEDKLFAGLCQGLRARYVGRMTTQNQRTFFYYARSSQGVPLAVERALASFPEYHWERSEQDDPEWSVYQDLLYPCDLDRQGIENRRIVDKLLEQGDDLTQSRDIDHWAYFPTNAARQEFIDQVEREGFLVELLDRTPSGNSAMTNDVPLPYGVHVTRLDRADLEFVDALVADLFLRVQACGGEYDGWGTHVVRNFW